MKVAIYTLGCKVNQYESAAIAERFKQRGCEVVGTDDFADIYIINTCTVTALADRKSRQYIRRMKKKNPDSAVAVCGCYVQISPDDVAAVEGVDIIIGTNEKAKLVEYVMDFVERRKAAGGSCGRPDVERHVLDYDALCEYVSDGIVENAEGRTRAYIKIQEGCNRFCSYCVIPFARGSVRSRDMGEIVTEAQALLEAGYKEIVLTGINTALYGIDWDDELHMHELIGALDELGGDFRIRLSSLEPTVVNASYVKKLLEFDRLCHHLHLSLQSGSDSILKAMNRRHDRSEYLDIVKVLQEADLEYGITTDIIVGFPGESDDDFNDSLRMVEEVCFGRVHPFRYSVRPGTKAAEMEGQISPVVKKQRVEKLSEAGDESSRKFFEKNLGKVRKLLVEEKTGDYYTGYTDNYIKVYVKEPLEVNEFYDVKLTGLHEDGMTAEKA